MGDNIWTLFAPAYDNVLTNWSMYQELIRRAIDYTEDADLIFDQGCGTGNISIALAQRGKTVFGVDDNPYMLNHGLKKIKGSLIDKVHLSYGDAQDLAFPNENFDAVISNNVLFFVDDPMKTLREAYRVLKPNGRFVVSGPRPTYINPPTNMGRLTEHITAEFKEQGVYYKLKEDLYNFVECSKKLKKDGMPNVYNASELENLLHEVGFRRTIASTEDTYLGLCYHIVVEK